MTIEILNCTLASFTTLGCSGRKIWIPLYKNFSPSLPQHLSRNLNVAGDIVLALTPILKKFFNNISNFFSFAVDNVTRSFEQLVLILNPALTIFSQQLDAQPSYAFLIQKQL